MLILCIHLLYVLIYSIFITVPWGSYNPYVCFTYEGNWDPEKLDNLTKVSRRFLVYEYMARWDMNPGNLPPMAIVLTIMTLYHLKKDERLNKVRDKDHHVAH